MTFAALWQLVGMPATRANQPPPDARSRSRHPARIFLADCAVCHGTDGRGSTRGPDLHGVGRASVYFQLSTGRMPLASPGADAERSRPAYDPATVDALVDEVVRRAGGGGPDIPHVDGARGDEAAGGELYRLNCAACHSWSGEGGALFHREAPSIHPATPTQAAAVIRAGSGNMPAFGRAALSDRQLADVLAYVDELDHPHDRGGFPLWHLGPFAEGLLALAVGLPVLLVATRWIGDRA